MHTRSTSKNSNATVDQDLEQKKALTLPELGVALELEDASFARSLYHDLASDSAIDAFLKNSRVFCFVERRWKIPRNYSKLIDANFYTPIWNVISSTLPSAPPGTKSSKVGFSNIASCIEIQVDGDEVPAAEQLARVGIYASGAQYTPSININEDPKTFVRLLLGLSSPNESDIGLDSSIQWRTENGRKVGGTLTTRSSNNEEIVYPLLSVDPCFRRANICGRCTICWKISDPVTGEELLVKDSWRSDGRVSEFYHLKEALGEPGVVQMVSCVPERGQTKDLRGFQDAVPPDFENRVETRIVMKFYGESIANFTSAKQLLCALRDAIAGHKGLFKKGSLHRDVSMQNVMLGRPGAEPGDLGVLIDLDMAARLGDDGFYPPTDWRIGITLYQSIAVLWSKSRTPPLPHDHLDDLESFLYIFTHIIYACDRHGGVYEVDDLVKPWDEYQGTAVADLKECFLTKKFIPKHILKRWPDALISVFRGFKAFILPMVDAKVDIMMEHPKDEPARLKALTSDAEGHYNTVIRLFDDGIAALEEEDIKAASQSSVQDSLDVDSSVHLT
ncbi:hypothetical protein MD484_g7573, partial [Candolleomyces efflorescens]